MSVKDIRSNLQVNLSNSGAFVADDTDVGTVIDTAHYELGTMFALAITAFTTGTFTLSLEESSDDGVADAYTAVPAAKLIGAAVATAATTAQLPTLGVFSNERYLRCTVTGTDTSVGTFVVTVTQAAETVPVVGV